MKTFFDIVGNKVELSFTPKSFQKKARHVFIICRFGDDWILTRHKKRGLEFPGGKVEAGETLEAAAHREVYEETGAILSELIRMGEYRVLDPKGSFVKAVFYGKVKQLHPKSDYLETDGPVAIRNDLLSRRFGKEFSFIMKDQVIEECLKQIEKQKG